MQEVWTQCPDWAIVYLSSFGEKTSMCMYCGGPTTHRQFVATVIPLKGVKTPRGTTLQRHPHPADKSNRLPTTEYFHLSCWKEASKSNAETASGLFNDFLNDRDIPTSGLGL